MKGYYSTAAYITSEYFISAYLRCQSRMLRTMHRMLAYRARLQVSMSTSNYTAVRKYASDASPHEENHIKSWKHGQHLGRIHIDRPKALNAMSAGKTPGFLQQWSARRAPVSPDDKVCGVD